MLFNSLEFIFLFLPTAFIGYFYLNHRGRTAVATAWLILASLFFYCWWDPIYLPLIVGSILFNFSTGTWLHRSIGKEPSSSRTLLSPKAILFFGVTCNLLLLGYFKYSDFFIHNLNRWLGEDRLSLLHMILPLGISFFTFTQIAFLVDVYKRQAKEYDLLNYALFVTYFPHLIAGPILHHREMMPQFADMTQRSLRYDNLAKGTVLFSIGLCKKVLIADTFAVWANGGFADPLHLQLIEAWFTSLSYTLQLYFDFSGYTDMALGISLLFNVYLPINFNSPYKALSIQEFWQRWHMTLSRFLKEYVYIPFGGNRHDEVNTCRNLLATFIIGGLWHGAGWTFIVWGAVHGVALVIQRLWQRLKWPMPNWLAWFVTFFFVNFAWVFFRAGSMSDAIEVVKGMFGFHGLAQGIAVGDYLRFLTKSASSYAALFNLRTPGVIFFILFFMAAVMMPNSMQWLERFKPNWRNALFIVLLLTISTVYLSFGHAKSFLYFNF